MMSHTYFAYIRFITTLRQMFKFTFRFTSLFLLEVITLVPEFWYTSYPDLNVQRARIAPG